MASLPLAFFAATCALLLATSASPPPLPPPPPPAVQRDVGHEMGWATTVPSVGNGTEETLTQWAERQRFHVGDVLYFKSWNRTVLLLARRGDYERCSATASPAATAMRFVGGGVNGDNVKFELYRPGTFYFVSGVPGRCEAGQRMAVRDVVDAQAPPFFFAPTSGVARPPDDEPAVPPPGTATPQATVVFKLTPSAWLWIATVGIFLLLLVGIVLFCVYEQTKVTTAFLGALGARVEYHKALSTELGRV